MCREKWDVHSVLLPEDEINFDKECERLNKIMDKYDCVNIFLSEGAGQQLIIDEKIRKDEYIAKDAFGHIRLDELDPGKWFANEFSKRLNANKILIQKSGYFSRSSKPNKQDLDLIIKYSDKAVESAVNGISGVIGLDEDDNNKLTLIDFSRIKGGKPFDINQIWFTKMMEEIKNI
jgi:pyrophosphate--fructose-6-phosphate 1-phosphotransferase